MDCHSMRRIKKTHGFGDSGSPVIISSISLGTLKPGWHRDKGELGLSERTSQIAGECPEGF